MGQGTLPRTYSECFGADARSGPFSGGRAYKKGPSPGISRSLVDTLGTVTNEFSVHNGSPLAEAAELSPEIQNEQDTLATTLEVELAPGIDPVVKSTELAAPGTSPVNTCSANDRSADGTSSDRTFGDYLSDEEEDMSIASEDDLRPTGQDNPERPIIPVPLQNSPDPYPRFSEKSFSLSDILAMPDDALNKILRFEYIQLLALRRLVRPRLLKKAKDANYFRPRCQHHASRKAVRAACGPNVPDIVSSQCSTLVDD
ncbi:uncharacterized protein EI90DRAFT_3120665 [Cantharellus anzutake]|uniref:uncharacterized protein n=1 Tax=Cantharellus anzutake TaxID=1750568 RepID=UPI0019059FFE|nr:uncharacterized protein EI90DRAFT_3120665 [Cantharellus anzutake]KAF8334878.1 hypothetical protein EI90DRAFT_3120665 [Cantharellus anzutake]